MKDYESTEIAYKNGYAQGKKDAVKHGKWIDDGTMFHRKRKCSVCGNCDSQYTAIQGHYCWFCGAKMDLEEE